MTRLSILRKPEVVRGIALLTVVCCALGMGFIAGYYEGTGILPTIRASEGVLPPEDVAIVSLQDTQTTILILQDKEYGEGYNCVDYAWEAMRLLRWQGQESAIVSLVLESGSGHAMLLIPTTDSGWVFLDPATGVHLKPRVGMTLGGRKVTAINVLQLIWVPIDDFLDNPMFGGNEP